MMRRLLLVCGLVSLIAVPLVSSPVAATTPATQVAVCGNGFGNFFGFQPWYACLQQKYGDTGTGKVQIRSLNDIFLVLFPVIESIIKVAVLVAASMIFFMLFKIITARGDSGKIATAIGGIRDAIIGLVIAMISVGVVNFIASGFTSS